jgi:uncharacterized protein YwgA
MENNYLVIKSIVKRIQSIAKTRPCKKTVQKVVYLIEEAGEELGFKYGIHFYGPYSSDLDYAIQYLNRYGELEIDITPFKHEISVKDDIEDNELSSLSNKTDKIIAQFGTKSASELELLATTLYVQRKMKTVQTTDAIVKSVKQIKGTKYSDIEINGAVSTLIKAEFFDMASLSGGQLEGAVAFETV